MSGPVVHPLPRPAAPLAVAAPPRQRAPSAREAGGCRERAVAVLSTFVGLLNAAGASTGTMLIVPLSHLASLREPKVMGALLAHGLSTVVSAADAATILLRCGHPEPNGVGALINSGRAACLMNRGESLVDVG